MTKPRDWFLRTALRSGSRGAARPGFLDVVIVVALLGILLYAAWREFPTYEAAAPSGPAAQSSR